MSEEFTVERVQALITRAPYHQWLGLEVVSVAPDAVEQFLVRSRPIAIVVESRLVKRVKSH